MFYLNLHDFHIVGASPEQLVKVEADGSGRNVSGSKWGRRVSTHPIAGTRKRGINEEEDLLLEADLLSDVKERAEHIMLVDLGRNDIGRIAVPGTVKVESLMHIERYSHVMHIVSVVSGTLSPSKSAYDAFRAVFPAGTLSGAPKIRAMQLISSLEGDHRNVYGGAVGYISYTGVLDVAIAIRTFVVKNNVAYLQAGAGIVYDSVPVNEWEETIKKMNGVVAAIDLAERTAASKKEREAKVKEKFAQNSNQQGRASQQFLSLLDHLSLHAKQDGISTAQLKQLIENRLS